MLKKISVLLLAAVLLLNIVACQSRTIINSRPAGAKLYMDESYVGKTPFTYGDTKVILSYTVVKLKKEGYKTLTTSIKKDETVNVGPLIGGLCLWPFLLWVLGYKPVYNFELEREGRNASLAR